LFKTLELEEVKVCLNFLLHTIDVSKTYFFST
jgi:hypothetical protein